MAAKLRLIIYLYQLTVARLIFVNDFAEIQNIYNQVSSLPELRNKTLKLDIDSEDYDVMSTPLNSMRGMINIFMVVILLLFAVVLTLLLAAWTKERNKEVGILISLGIAKRNVIAQFVAEVLIISSVSFTASYVLSPFIENLASSFLRQIQNVQMENMDQQTEEILPSGAGQLYASQLYDQLTGSYSQKEFDFQVQIMTQHYVLSFTVGLLLIVISTLLASAKIINMKPKELLAKKD